MPESHRCRRCGLAFPIETFMASRRRVGDWRCRGCIRADNRKHYRENLAYIDAVKLAAGCADCGYDKAAVALDFDHLPGCEKVDRVAALAGCSSLARIKAEIAKCEVVCSNCHRIRTAARGQAAAWWEEWRSRTYADTPMAEGIEDGQLSFPSEV